MRRRRQLASPPEEHAQREKTALRAVKRLQRSTIGAANAGQCATAFDKFSSLAYWMGVLETEERGEERARGAPSLIETQMSQYSRAKQAVRTNCMIPARPGRRR